MLDLSELDKDGLAEYAQNVFGKSLDMRKGIEKLREEVKALQENPPLWSKSLLQCLRTSKT